MSDSRVQVLLFDEDAAVARALARRLESEAVRIMVASNVDQLRERLSDSQANGLIVCAEKPELVNSILSELRGPGCPSAVFRAEKLTPLWELQGWLTHLVNERDAPNSERGFERLIGSAQVMQELRAQVRRVAPFSDMSVLITGETGTGKELVAQAIHQRSCPDQPFISVNCAAIPANLFEAELFGHTKGAFTDAEHGRGGLLEQAGSGTLFLDEVGELPRELQPKLLRTLETRRFRRVGAQREQTLGARLVSATHVQLLDGGESFRSDLYFRLAGYAIHCPPLRERREDIPALAAHFLYLFCRSHAMSQLQLSREALDLLMTHPFAGNVRELRGVIETAAVGCSSYTIERGELDAILHPSGLMPSRPPSFAPTSRVEETSLWRTSNASVARHLVGPGRPFASLSELEKNVILSALAECKGSVSRASTQLGMARSTLRDKLRRYHSEEVSDDVVAR